MNPSTFNPSLPYITDRGQVFQVLNRDGTDWDESKTEQVYHDWLVSLLMTVTDALKTTLPKGVIH